MKKISSLVMSFLFVFVTTAHAAVNPVSQAIRDYRVNVQVRNMDAKSSMDKLALDLIESGATKEDLITYVKENSSEEEFKNFVAIVEAGAMELDNLGSVSQNDFRYVMSTALSASSIETGANYAGCGAVVGLGVVAIVAGVVLGVMALEANGNFDRNSSDIDFDVNNRDEERAQELGIAAGVSGAVGIAMVAGGASC